MKKRHFLLLLALVLALSLVGGTWSYYKHEAEVVNRISTQESGITLREVFAAGDKWLPGETKEKQVSFYNSGETVQLLRFQFKGTWYDNAGNPWTSSTYEPFVKMGAKISTDWQKIDDWYYYKKTLQPNENTANVIESLTFDSTLTNGGYDGKPDYSDKRYSLTVTLESTGQNPAETEAIWGMKYTKGADNILTWQEVT